MIKVLQLSFTCLLATIIFVSGLFAQSNLSKQLPADLVGHWDFNNSDDLTEARVGVPLILVGSHIAVVGPSDTSGAVRIGVGSHYISQHGISSNGGGTQVNNYSIIIDIKIPSIGQWYAIYQTQEANTADGDWFINPSGNMGVGATGYTSGELIAGDWYRIGISVSNGVMHNYYIDGKKALNGAPGSVDGRFALDSKVLFFADENSEDNILDVADIKVFSRNLDDAEMADLGGYGHELKEIESESKPYLQTPTPTSVHISWTYKGSNAIAEYGTTASLGNHVLAETIPIDDGNTYINWYNAKLENLEPSTIYYYKVRTDSTESEIYRFRTQPVDNDSTERIRFAIYGDNRTVPAKFSEVNDSLKSKAISLYGENLEEVLNLVYDVGDIVTNGHVLSQYLPEYFAPVSSISTNVPFMVSIGNHENESPHYYKFMKYEEVGGSEGEKYYSHRIGRVLLIGLNSNRQLRNNTQVLWLNQILAGAQADETVEWIFVFLHHPGHSEIWPDGNTEYVQNSIIPTLAKYSKVDMLTYGHSHNYERGTALNSNFRLMLNGGAGSKLDRWGMYNNQENYPEIQKSFDHYCYSIVDIDIANKFFEVTTYSLGHLENPLDNVVIDHFIRNKEDETPPADPSFVTPLEDDFVEFPFILQASEYAGNYEIMSSQFQVTNNKGVYDKPLLNILRDFEDIYGAPQAPDYFSVDLNQGIDLTKVVVPELNVNGDIWARVRYRDKNLQWSSWSPELDLVIVDPTNVEEEESVVVKEYKLHNNYPNPFNPSTSIRFDIVETSIVTLKVYNSLGQFITELENGKLAAGRYVRSFDISNLSSGVYFYKLTANNFSAIGKMNLLK